MKKKKSKKVTSAYIKQNESDFFKKSADEYNRSYQHSGKGSCPRPCNRAVYDENWDSIDWGK